MLTEWFNEKFYGWHAVMVKEWIEILHDKFTLAFILVMPVVQMIIYGFGVSFEVRNVDTVVLNLDRRHQAQTVLNQLYATGYFRVRKEVYSRHALVGEIVAGRARAGIIVPPDFTAKVEKGTPGQIQVLIDGSDSTVANAIQNASMAVGQNRSIQILTELSADRRPRPPVEVRPRMLFNPDVRTTNFMLPGLVGFMAQTITLFLTINAIVREREIGTLEQVLVTPVRPLGLLLGKLLPYCMIGFIGTNLLLTAMFAVFHVPANGNIFLLEVCTLIFVFVALSIGILISTAAATQAQAMQFAIFIIVPSVLLSGFIFPRESMPLLLNWIGYLIPLTYFLQIQRGIVLRGAGLEDLWVWILPLVFFGYVLLFLSVKRFRTTLG